MLLDKEGIPGADPHVTRHPRPRAGTRSLPPLPSGRKRAARRDSPPRYKCGRRSTGALVPRYATLVSSSALPLCDESCWNVDWQRDWGRRLCRKAPSNLPYNGTHPALAVPSLHKARSTSLSPASRLAIAYTPGHKSARFLPQVAVATPSRKLHRANSHIAFLSLSTPSPTRRRKEPKTSLSLSLSLHRYSIRKLFSTSILGSEFVQCSTIFHAAKQNQTKLTNNKIIVSRSGWRRNRSIRTENSQQRKKKKINLDGEDSNSCNVLQAFMPQNKRSSLIIRTQNAHLISRSSSRRRRIRRHGTIWKEKTHLLDGRRQTISERCKRREKGDFLSRERERALNIAGSGRNRGRRRCAREQQRSPWSSKWGPRLQGLFV